MITNKTRLEVANDLFDRNALITDARSGGLIIGVSHEDGGIAMVQANRVEGHPLWIAGEMEGMEFLMNPLATEKHLDRLKVINSYRHPSEEVSDLSGFKCKGYNINKGDAILVSNNTQFIVNRRATLRYLRELVELNNDGKCQVPHSGQCHYPENPREND